MKHLAIFLTLFSLNSKTLASPECQEQALSFKERTFQVQVLKYANLQPNSKTILIMPPTGGTTILDRSYAGILCEKGFDVLILAHWTNDDEYSLDLQIHQRFYERSQKAIALTLKNIKSPYIGILGTSVGAIHAAVATHHFKQIQAAFLIVGGAPLAEVIASSDQEILAEARKKRFTTMGFRTHQEYVQALDKILPMDPFKSPSAAQGKQLAMVIAPSDTTVPGVSQKALKDLWKPQWMLELSGNHLVAIIKTWLFHRNEMANFFEKSSAK